MKLLFALFPLFVWSLPNSVSAQVRDGISTGNDVVYGKDGVDVLYSHTSGIHLIAHSQGAGVGAHYGLFLNAKTSRSINADLVYFKHEKEEKTSNPVYNDGLPYVF